MKIEMWDITRLKPYEANPRKNDGAVDALARNIEEFGFRQPLIVDADGVLIAGHTRLKAAQKLGLVKAPVHVARDLTPEQIRACRIADNKTGELAIEYSSRPGQRVLDLFGGSGSTLIACEQTGRRALLMEIDPAYCDVIVERWERFTGKQAERVAGYRTRDSQIATSSQRSGISASEAASSRS